MYNAADVWEAIDPVAGDKLIHHPAAIGLEYWTLLFLPLGLDLSFVEDQIAQLKTNPRVEVVRDQYIYDDSDPRWDWIAIDIRLRP